MIILTVAVGYTPNSAQTLNLNNDFPNLAVLSLMTDPAIQEDSADTGSNEHDEDLQDNTSLEATQAADESADSSTVSADVSRRPVQTAQAAPVSRSQTSPPPAPAPPDPDSAPSVTNINASAIVATAKQYLGVPYVWGGISTSGFDCSGLVKFVYDTHGKDMPRVSRDQYTVGTAVSLSSLQPADLVFFSLNGNNVDHVGIYIGNGQFIHASSSKGVTVSEMSSYWTAHFVGGKRVG